RGAVGINGRVKYLPLAWAWTPKTSFRKNSDSPTHLYECVASVISGHSGMVLIKIETKSRVIAEGG
ncbi:hypothetical protein BOW53_15900, partial [Solemya pervernicosa gill symbiont]